MSANGRKILKYCAALLLLAMQVGCGGGAGATAPTDLSADQKQIVALVSGISDNARDLASLRTVFTKDAAPSSSALKGYKDSFFSVNGDVVISGTTATIPVKATSYSSGAEAIVSWTATKDGDKWKLTQAPVK